jgi:hypothetical protein
LELAMATRVCCRFCRVEFARIALADGSAAVMCLECQVMQFEHKRDVRLRVVSSTAHLPKRVTVRKRTRVKAARGG